MPITNRGEAKDNRGRRVLVVATDLPGKYPVVGVQITQKGTGVAKDGLKLYTAEGKFYANGGRTRDPLDLNLSTFVQAAGCDDEEEADPVEMVYTLNGAVVARRNVTRDGEEFVQLEADGWTVGE